MRRVLSLIIVAGLAGCSEQQAQQDAGSAAKAPAEVAENLRLDAKGIPQFRAGLWDVVSTDSTKEEDKVDHEHHCMGDSANEEFAKALSAQSPNCKVERTGDARSIKITSNCEQSGVKVRTELAVAGGETKYETRLKMGIVMPDGTTDGGEIVAKARWIGGACPAGMAPGESVDVE